MKYKMLIAVFLSAALACAGSQTAPGKPSNEFTADMLPMKVGNSWTYTYVGMSRKPETTVFKIDNSREFNGRKYYHFSRWFTLTLAEDRGGAWLRYEDGEIFQHTDAGEEKLIGRGIENTELTVGSKPLEGEGTVDAVFRTCVRCADAGSTFYFRRGAGIVQVYFNAIWGGSSYKLHNSELVTRIGKPGAGKNANQGIGIGSGVSQQPVKP